MQMLLVVRGQDAATRRIANIGVSSSRSCTTSSSRRDTTETNSWIQPSLWPLVILVRLDGSTIQRQDSLSSRLLLVERPQHQPMEGSHHGLFCFEEDDEDAEEVLVRSRILDSIGSRTMIQDLRSGSDHEYDFCWY
jgi:hypothetical protein